MKKSTPNKYKVKEAATEYATTPKVGTTPYFAFNQFQKIADKTDFTQKDWADILHLSERTIQRYSKDNSSFSFSASDRIAQVNKILEKGKEVFGSYFIFLNWLRSEPTILEGRISIHSLSTIEGCHQIQTQLGRIQHGLFS